MQLEREFDFFKKRKKQLEDNNFLVFSCILFYLSGVFLASKFIGIEKMLTIFINLPTILLPIIFPGVF